MEIVQCWMRAHTRLTWAQISSRVCVRLAAAAAGVLCDHEPDTRQLQ
jgi:hypothetical protein